MSRCGVICHKDCKAYQEECEGCITLSGRVSWAHWYGSDTCPIYACCLGKGFEHCGECSHVPCQIWYDTRNPDATDAEFAADLDNRQNNLRRAGEKS